MQYLYNASGGGLAWNHLLDTFFSGISLTNLSAPCTTAGYGMTLGQTLAQHISTMDVCAIWLGGNDVGSYAVGTATDNIILDASNYNYPSPDPTAPTTTFCGVVNNSLAILRACNPTMEILLLGSYFSRGNAGSIASGQIIEGVYQSCAPNYGARVIPLLATSGVCPANHSIMLNPNPAPAGLGADHLSAYGETYMGYRLTQMILGS